MSSTTISVIRGVVKRTFCIGPISDWRLWIESSMLNAWNNLGTLNAKLAIDLCKSQNNWQSFWNGDRGRLRSFFGEARRSGRWLVHNLVVRRRLEDGSIRLGLGKVCEFLRHLAPLLIISHIARHKASQAGSDCRPRLRGAHQGCIVPDH